MGTKQIVILFVGLTIVGLALMIAFSMAGEETVQHTRDSLHSDMALLVQRVQTYYRKPLLQGGGGNSFNELKPDKIRLTRATNLETDNELWVTPNGTYTLVSVTPDSVVLEGIGVELGQDGNNPVMIRAVIRPHALVIHNVN